MAKRQRGRAKCFLEQPKRRPTGVRNSVVEKSKHVGVHDTTHCVIPWRSSIVDESTKDVSRRNLRRRLTILLVFESLLIVAFILSRWHPPSLDLWPLKSPVQKFIADAKTLGGKVERTEDLYSVSFKGTNISDRSLSLFREKHREFIYMIQGPNDQYYHALER
jgi:hypothetical protein